MFKQLVNECLVDLHIKVEGPVLIKSGLAQVSGPDMAWVRVFRNGREEVYLPGSSLKGVLRSHAERIARTLNPGAACDPFADTSCGRIFDKKKPETAQAYQDACLICKLFGCTGFAGRLATTDAYAVGTPPEPVQRDGVGIDRFSGGAAHGAKFELEVITEGTFETMLHLRNFELWQLALLGFVLQDFSDGLIRIGMGKSRGLGKVCGEVQKTRIDFLGPKAPQVVNGQLTLRGVGSLFDGAGDYGMVSPDEVTVPYDGEVSSNGLRTSVVFPAQTFPWSAIADRWVQRATDFTDLLASERQGGRR
ncbi:MAG: RAMP superfamily CRISPR-associated protein [Anaerolineae bacterium]|jgi:CRISPR-associated RAMP protein (TIGR02581 family)|nr:RAMP superfamily CRISPR-associated protein [Anaerolineae bacterium]MDH7475140.1 RAMP superfamily CRISPR-associated protein [Anaerolineae bacterium]